MTDRIDLNAIEDLELETMPEGEALGCVFCASTYSTASCPGASVACVSTGSTMG
ncbi:thiocillin family RiPP [Actinomyces ruminicola]|uniref:thiocillin family RiPP n=1 Tax=Actinomyces ruminicola TaxID=332524 RepID=UPI0011C72DC8|nr:thiocillin family RiPP [Actinomyces ruminicola]